jgi:hypothetical protein
MILPTLFLAHPPSTPSTPPHPPTHPPTHLEDGKAHEVHVRLHLGPGQAPQLRRRQIPR